MLNPLLQFVSSRARWYFETHKNDKRLQARWQRIADGENVSPEPNAYELELVEARAAVIKAFWKDAEE